MPVNDGHITAPINPLTVMQTLGESRQDTQSLCRSHKINPDSIIRPLYWNRDIPGVNPAEFAPSELPGLVPLSLPAARKNRIDSGFNIVDYPEEFPCVSDFGLAGYSTVQYAKCKWGYFVPYVTNTADIGALRDVMWERFGPEFGQFDTNGRLTDCFAEMQQFDGYLHNATPKCPIRNAVLEYGKKFAIYFTTDVGNYTEAQILGTQGKAHPGGTVSIPAIFGSGGFYYGFSVFKRERDNEPFIPLWHIVAGPVVAQNPGGNTITEPAGIKPDVFLTRYTYIVIPWVADGPTVETATRFYGCYFSAYHGKEKYYLQKEIIPKTVQFGRVFTGTGSPWAISSDGNYWVIKFWICNTNNNYALKATDFLFEYTYKPQASGNSITAGVASNPIGCDGDYGISGYTPASVTEITPDAPVSFDGTALNAERQITMRFQKPNPCYSDLPTFSRLVMKSLDGNVEGRANNQPLRLTIVLLNSGTPHIINGMNNGMSSPIH